MAKVKVVAMKDRYRRTVTARTIGAATPGASDSVYNCAGDDSIFVAGINAFAYAYDARIGSAALGDCHSDRSSRRER